MEERLKSLKSSMDSTILKNGSISKNEKQKILRASLQGQEKRKRYILAPVLSVVFIISVLCFSGAVIFNQAFENNNAKQMQKPTSKGDMQHKIQEVKSAQSFVNGLKQDFIAAEGNEDKEIKVAQSVIIDDEKYSKVFSSLDLKDIYSNLLIKSEEYNIHFKEPKEIANMNNQEQTVYFDTMNLKRESFMYAVFDIHNAFYQKQGFYTTYSTDYSNGTSQEFVKQNSEKFKALQQAADALYNAIGTESSINKDETYMKLVNEYQNAHKAIGYRPQ